MVFDLRKFVPEVYRDSRDYRTWLKLFGVVCTTIKYSVDTLPFLFNADQCPEDLLPLLADELGYKYDDSLPIVYNRLIMKYFTNMINNRGNEIGIKLAVTLSINTSRSVSTDGFAPIDTLAIDFDHDTGTLIVYYPNTEEIRNNLIEYVRPVGTVIKLVPSSSFSDTETLRLRASVKGITKDYSINREKLNRNNVGFGNTDMEKYSKPESENELDN